MLHYLEVRCSCHACLSFRSFLCPPLLMMAPQTTAHAMDRIHGNGCCMFFIIYRVCSPCTDVPDIQRSTLVLIKIILALFLSLRYLNCLCLLSLSLPEEILLTLVIIYFLPGELVPVFSPLSLLCAFWALFASVPGRVCSAAGLRITAALRETEEGDEEKKITPLECVSMRFRWRGPPLRELNQDSTYTLCGKDQTPSLLTM